MAWTLLLGASGDIGSSIGRQLCALNRTVVGVDVREARLSQIEHIRTDLRSPDRGWLQELVVRKGAPTEIVAAMGIYYRYEFGEYDDESFRDVLTTNFSSLFWLLQALLPSLIKKGGRIVVVGSQAGATGGADPVYAASKAACTALVKSIAREYGRFGVLANIVAPGPVLTAMATKAMSQERIDHYRRTIPIGRLLAADEVAEAVTFLLTSAQGAINGATIDVDGGLVRR